MKNPYGVEPTRYMKKEDGDYAITCMGNFGPTFGSDYPFCDILIKDNCNNNSNNRIGDPSSFRYEYHPQYKSSLYVNTAGPDSYNYFTVLDYEVFTHN